MWLLGAAKFAVLGRILGSVPEAEYGSMSSDVIALGMGYLAVEAAGAAEDPPRADFTTSTRAKRRRLPTYRLGESALEREAEIFAETARYAAAYLAAFVRAVERSQMADQVRAEQAVALRIGEADVYARRAATSIRHISEHELPLAYALESDTTVRQAARDQFRGPKGRQLLATPFWEKLDLRILTLFREARVNPEELATDWNRHWPDDPVGSCAIALRAATTSSVVLARELEEWGPTSERSEIPAFWDVDPPETSNDV